MHLLRLLALTLLFPLSLFAAGHDVTTTVPARQMRPIVASDGADFLSVWLESNGLHQQAVAGQFSRSGEPRDGSGIPLANVGVVNDAAVAHGPGSQMLIVQSSESGLWAERWAGITGPLDGEPILISNKTSAYPAVVWNGMRYFVVWSGGTQLFGAFVEDGAVSPPISLPFASATHGGMAYSTSVAWDGREFLVAVFASDSSVCTTLCLGPLPGELRMFRVSADGNVLDVPAIEIPGNHGDAHIASSGSEFLIAFDNATSVSSMVVRLAAGGVQLREETTIFSWPAYVPSAVAWDGSAYVVTWRYAAGHDAWLATARIDRSGNVSSTAVAATFPPEPFSGIPVAIAVNNFAETAIVVEEAAPPSSLSRARVYFTPELAPMPAAPAAPQNAVSYLGGSTALIEWQSDGGAADFLLEESVDFGNSWFRIGTVGGDVRSTTVRVSIGNLVRVSALGPGGVSSGTITSIGSPQRRHAERR